MWSINQGTQDRGEIPPILGHAHTPLDLALSILLPLELGWLWIDLEPSLGPCSLGPWQGWDLYCPCPRAGLEKLGS